MKRIIFVIAAISIATCCFSQHIPNGGFENWTSAEPDNWTIILPMLSYDFVTKENIDVNSGQNAAKLTSRYLSLYGVLIPAVISNGSISMFGSISGGMPFISRPSSFFGYYKYMPVNSDTCTFHAVCTKYNTATQSRDTICFASYENHSNTSSWQYFQIPFSYLSSLDPDTMLVYFISSKSGTIQNDGSVLLLDDIGIDACGSTPYEGQEICVVSIDTITWKNKIVWEKTPYVNTKSFTIYKETSLNNYDSIGNVPYSDPGAFVDITSAPESHADKYKISVIDSCDNESDLSFYHKTMNLVISSFGSTMGLSWSHYEDESGIFIPLKYYIFKGTQPDNMTLLDSISSSFNSYNDNNVFSVYYYMIGVKKDPPCNINGNGMSYSNKKDNSTLVGVFTQNGSYLEALNIYPNPFKETTTINFYNPDNNPFTLSLTDASGRIVHSTGNVTGSELVIDRKELNSGIYFLELKGEGKLYRGKIVIE